MKICFISNYLNHHQLPLCLEIIKISENDDFKFIATTPTNPSRCSMYNDMNTKYQFVILSYISDSEMKKAKFIIDDYDVVIMGSAPDYFIINRLKKGKLTFKYSERLYKKGLNIKNFPKAIISAYLHHGKFQKYPLYILCASAYTSYDLNIFGNYKEKVYKWGYFPEVKEYNLVELFSKKTHNLTEILWVGRLLNWKHPEDAIKVAQKLKENNISFHFNIIGIGDHEEEVKKIINNNDLNDCIDLLGAMSPEKVREYMESANIFIFTSDFYEGWGAVLNEAMNSGCAVVASHAIGSVPYLISDKQNGVIYEYGNFSDLYNKVCFLIEHNGMQKEIGINAYYTMINNWNVKIAVERLFVLINDLIKYKNCDKYINGPCSKAKILKNKWYNQKYII